jgi:hypothetical protein
MAHYRRELRQLVFEPQGGGTPGSEATANGGRPGLLRATQEQHKSGHW